MLYAALESGLPIIPFYARLSQAKMMRPAQSGMTTYNHYAGHMYTFVPVVSNWTAVCKSWEPSG